MALDWLVVVPQKIFRWLIPTWEDRLPTGTTTAMILSNAYIIPYYYLCYLSRRRNTYKLRLLLLPVIVIGALKGTFSFGGEYDPNTHLGLGAITVLANSLDLALSKDGRLKIGETKLPDGKDDSQRKSPGHRDRVLSRMERLFPQWFLDIADVAYSARGLGWKFGQGVHIPKENRPLERGPFLRATAVTTFVHWCLLDFVLSILPFLPGIGTPPGGSIYYEQLSPVPRHLVAFTLTVLSGGVAIVSSLRMEYGVITLFAVGILGHSPSAWPPLFDNPWMSTSIHEFWGKRWHQGLRRAFLVLGGYPGEWIAGKVGLVCGAFLASGLYHELSMYLVHRGVDHRVTFFYSFQAIGIILEKVFVKITGRKVVGPFGWCWTFLFVAGTAQFCIDSWFIRGLAAVPPVIPLALSPCRRFIFPLIQTQIESLVSVLK